MLVRQPRRKQEWRVFVYDFEPERIDVLRGELSSLLDGELEDGELEDGELEDGELEDGVLEDGDEGGGTSAEVPPVSAGDGV